MPLIIQITFSVFFFLFLSFPNANAQPQHPEKCEARPFDNGRLWQISKPGSAPSFVFGTMHSKDPRILHLPGIVMQAFNQSTVIMIETSLKDENIANSQKMMMAPVNFSLRKTLGNDRFTQLTKLVAPYGLSEQVLDRLKIWAAAAVISQPPKPKSKGEADLTLLDRELEKLAYQLRKSVQPLETMTEQLSLFDSMSPAVQIEYLTKIMSEHSELDAEIERLTNHYLAGQTGWIFCDMEVSLEEVSRSLASFMEDKLIGDRNKRMVERMLPFIEKGRSFVAIGALHLPGEDGVLSLLHARGYKVVRKF